MDSATTGTTRKSTSVRPHEVDGELPSDNRPRSVAELSRRSGIPESALRARLARNGGNIELALSEPRRSPAQAGRIGARRSPWRYPAADDG